MAKFRKKPVVIEAITFDELVEYGKTHGANILNGMPWSFEYQGQPITHENDDCYLIPTLEGTMKFYRGDMLITGVNGEIYPCAIDIFAKTYEPAGDGAHSLAEKSIQSNDPKVIELLRYLGIDINHLLKAVIIAEVGRPVVAEVTRVAMKEE